MKIQYPIRKFVSFSVISTICLLISFNGLSQCALGTFYDSGIAPLPGLISNISPCDYAGEYNTVTDVVAGDIYSVTVSGTYITVYDNSSVAVAYGNSPVSFTATSSGVYSTQINTDSVCGTDNICHQCEWENISPGPSNDSCANATTINCGDVIVGETIYATDDAPFIAGQSLQGCGPGIAANTPGVWYYFLGTGDDVVASTCNAADFDTRITIYSGSCGSLACVAGNDDGPTCSGYTSEASFQTTVGVDYYIFVHGYGNSLAEQGNFTLSLSCSAACAPLPGNDACGSAQSLNVYVAGSCTPTAGSNLCAADATANPTCDPWGIIQDVWYTFNTGANASLSIDLQAITANPNGLKMALYSSCGGTEIDCFSGGAGVQSIGGLSSVTDYYLQVWSSSIDEGDFTVCVSESSCDVLVNVSVSPASSAGGSDGNASAIVSGNQGNLSYLWSTGATTAAISGLVSATYGVTVTDDVSSGCTAISSGYVTDPSVTVSCSITGSITGNNPTLYGASDGSVTAIPNGNQGNITYNWSSGSAAQALTGLAGGVFSVTITDDITTGCSATASVTLTEPAPTCNLFLTAVGYDVSTNGGSDGSAQAFVSGGQSIVSYIWSSGATTAISTGLSAGVESVTIVDNIIPTCSVTDAITITQPICAVSASVSGNNATIYGGSDGAATASAIGGQGIVSYLWSNATTTATITGLIANDYSVTITDDIAPNCQAIAEITITEPLPTCNLSLTVVGYDVSTNGGSDGSAQVFVSGGQSILSYIWTSGSTTDISTGLSVGIEFVTIVDNIIPNCSVTDAITITQLFCTVSASVAGNDATTNGGSDGDAMATVTGGQGNITYLWSNGGSTAMISGLIAGTYSVTVMDDILVGCEVVDTLAIAEPALTCDILANLSVTAATTAGGSDGEAEALVSGAQGTLTYIWSNGGITSMITGLPTNTYLVTVTDDVIAGCTASASGLVTDPSVTVSCNISVTAASINPTSYGASDGSATAVPSGNQGNLSYLWDNAVAAQVINGLTGGIFTVTVSDDILAGCEAVGIATITEPAAPVCNITLTASGNNASTTGGSDGDAIAMVTGAQSNITYMWTNGSTTSLISGLIAGTYSVTVIDDVLLGCEAVDTLIISEPPAGCFIAATIAGTNVTNNGSSDGSAAASISGELGNITYAWSNGETTSAIVNITAGVYTVTVTDDTVAGCSAAATVTITEPALTCDILANLSVTAATTAGGSDGAAEALVSGAQGNLSYMWSNGGTTSMITGLPTNTYSVTVTDDVIAGCTASASGLVTDPSVTVSCNISVTATSIDPTSYGASDGSATAIPAGNQGNLSYLWDNAAATQLINGLTGGIFTVTLTDGITAGCAAIASVTLTEPAPTCNVSLIASGNDPTTIGGSDGDAMATVTGGQSNITYMWSNGGTTSMISGLSAGIYSVTVMDDILVGCEVVDTLIIAEPALSCTVGVTLTGNDVTTTGGSDGDAMATATGGQSNITYMWSNGGSTSMISGLSAGTYSVTVMDDILAGCEVVDTLIIAEPALSCTVGVTLTGNDVTTIGGSDGDAMATVTGGQGNVTYLWDNSSTTALITGLSVGTYSVTVKDNVLAGCEAAATVTISEPAIVTCTLAASLSATDATLNGASDGMATVTVSGEQGTVTYAWSNAETTASITGLVAGSYTVTVTDDATADCNVVDTVTVGEPQSIGELNNSIEMTLYPNPNNGNFSVSISEVGNYNVVIRNVIGQSIYRNLINGTITEVKLQNVESGIYLVTIQSDGFERTEKLVIK